MACRLLLREGMRRALFALWLVAMLVVLFGVGQLLYPPVAHFGSPGWLLVASIWLVGVVPLSFRVWFRLQHQREQQVVETALKSWRAGAADAGALVAQAIELALADEDEASLRRLMEVLAQSAPARLAPTLTPFMQAATEWLADDGGHSSRDEHLQRAREAARPLLPELSASGR